MNPPTIPDFDYDTLTLAQAYPWLKIAVMILIGSFVAAVTSVFGNSPAPLPASEDKDC